MRVKPLEGTEEEVIDMTTVDGEFGFRCFYDSSTQSGFLTYMRKFRYFKTLDTKFRDVINF